MTVLVVFSMLSLSCGVDDLRPCRRRLALNSLRGLKELFPPQNVRTSFWKECSRDAFVRSAVRRDLAHNLLDWSLSLLLVCFTFLVDNYLVAEVH